MQKIAIIDLGSNSVRLVLVKVMEPNGYFYVYDELKESVRLAQDVGPDGSLNSIRIGQTIKTLKMFKNLCDANGIDQIYAFTTAAVRQAANQRSFLEQVQFSCGFKLKVLTDEEECTLVHKGVINSLDIPKGLIVDIGGGSTEIVYYNRRVILGTHTLPYGAVTLTEKFKDSSLTPEQRNQKIEDYVYNDLQKIPFMSELDPETVFIGVGGSFRNFGKISRKIRNYPLTITQNYVADKNNFLTLYSHIRKLELDSTMKIKGLSSARADIFPSALAEMAAFFKKGKFESVTISGSGIREGYMYMHSVPTVKDKPLSDILGFSLYTILHSCSENIHHAEKVYDLALQLYQQLRVLHKLPRNYIKILRTASLLHSTGNRVNYYDHHRHSMYMILNSRINGLTHRELVIAAFVAGLHRNKEIPKDEIAKYIEILEPEDTDIIMKLGVILRIAESLDRSMCDNVDKIKCDILGDSVIMKLEPNPEKEECDYSLEIKDALSAVSEFKKAYKKNLQIIDLEENY